VLTQNFRERKREHADSSVSFQHSTATSQKVACPSELLTLYTPAALFTTERARSIIIARFIRPSIHSPRQVSLSLCPSPRAGVALSNLPTHDPKRIRKLPDAGPAFCWLAGRVQSDASGTCDYRQDGEKLRTDGRSIGWDWRLRQSCD